MDSTARRVAADWARLHGLHCHHDHAAPGQVRPATTPGHDPPASELRGDRLTRAHIDPAGAEAALGRSLLAAPQLAGTLVDVA